MKIPVKLVLKLITSLFLIALLAIIAPQYAAAQAHSTLYNFGANATDGVTPVCLIEGTNGKLYGTTSSGGTNGGGTVFTINTDGTGYTVLYNFGANANDGAIPGVLIEGRDGKLYGATAYGGANGETNSGYGDGTIFTVNADGTGYAVLYNFGANASDGIYPNSLIEGRDGKLYGTTYDGGPNNIFDETGSVPISLDNDNDGTVFTINTNGTGYTILHDFGANDSDGVNPGSLIEGTDGKLYGVTSEGGFEADGGTVFKINTDGTNYTIFFGFPWPYRLIQGSDGKLYGGTSAGESFYCDGTLFKLNTDGTELTFFYSYFYDDGIFSPNASPIQGTDGKLYGTTFQGGGYLRGNNNEINGGGDGTVFTVNTDGTGYATLYNFGASAIDGIYPAPLIEGTDGKLYGVTSEGGANGDGTIFKIDLTGAPTQTSATYMLWDKSDGTADLWDIAPDGTITGNTYGPFTGYTAKAIAADGSNHVHLLWNNTNGTADLWDIAPDGTITGQAYGPFSGYTAKALAVGLDNHVHLLWDNTNGTAALWNIDTNGTITGQTYGPFSGYNAANLAVGADNAVHLIWNNANNSIDLWNMATDGTVTGQTYGPFTGYTSTAFAVGSDNAVHLLWDNTNGIGDLWDIAANGNITGNTYGPFSGYTAQAFTVGADNYTHLLWDNTNGAAALWDIAPDGTIMGNTYGPFTGYTAVSVSATP